MQIKSAAHCKLPYFHVGHGETRFALFNKTVNKEKLISRQFGDAEVAMLTPQVYCIP